MIFYAGTWTLYVLPVVVGVFWGAPMIAREIEAGTSRLVWTQSVTRTRWLAIKLGVAGIGAAVVGLGGLALTWWCAPIDDAVAQGLRDPGLLSVPRLWPELFAARGVVPIGTSVLALVIGVTAGLLVRRSIPAMAVTLVAVIAVQILLPSVVQKHLMAPKQVTTTITQERLTEFTGRPGSGPDEIVVERIGGLDRQPRGVDHLQPHGRRLGRRGADVPVLGRAIARSPPGQTSPKSQACFERLASEGYRQHVEYQPASRFWSLQVRETGLLLGLAALLTGFCFWRIRRDLT